MIFPGTETRKETPPWPVPVPARNRAVSGRAEGRVGMPSNLIEKEG